MFYLERNLYVALLNIISHKMAKKSKISNEKIVGVITGDIINSREMNSKEWSMVLRNLKSILIELEKEYEGKAEIFRGDSFQMVIDAKYALTAALLLKFFIKSLQFDARIALGIGKIKAPATQIVTSMGEAFELSGSLLDLIKSNAIGFAIETNDKNHEELTTEGVLINAIIEGVTPSQAEVLYHKLRGETEVNIAQLLEISQPSVNQRSKSGNWHAFDVLLDRFEVLYS